VPVVGDNPTARAERLLQDVLGEQQFRRLRSVGYLDLPSRRYRGRVYRLDNLGHLAYRDAGESGFHTTLCVQPQEAIPPDDEIVVRYLLITADEDRLLEVANPIRFGLVPLARAIQQDFRERYPSWLSVLLTASSMTAVLAALLACLGGEIWAIRSLLAGYSLALAAWAAVLLIPAFAGVVLVAAGIAECWRSIHTWYARCRLPS
jgi:hypothetical protein